MNETPLRKLVNLRRNHRMYTRHYEALKCKPSTRTLCVLPPEKKTSYTLCQILLNLSDRMMNLSNALNKFNNFSPLSCLITSSLTLTTTLETSLRAGLSITPIYRNMLTGLHNTFWVMSERDKRIIISNYKVSF